MDEVVLGGGGGGSRTQGSGLWNGEAHHYATGKGRNYADGAGTMDAMGYRLVPGGVYVLSVLSYLRLGLELDSDSSHDFHD